jgi:hypothetical protein
MDARTLPQHANYAKKKTLRLSLGSCLWSAISTFLQAILSRRQVRSCSIVSVGPVRSEASSHGKTAFVPDFT